MSGCSIMARLNRSSFLNILRSAEFILCSVYLKETGLPAYREGVQYLLDSQNSNGSWGRYENERQFMGDYVDQGLYLHTTMVAMDALVVAFQPR